MSSQCFGEESKELVTANDSLGKQQRRRGELVGRIASLLWHMDNSSGYEKMINRDRSRPVTVPFKVNHQMLVLSNRPNGTKGVKATVGGDRMGKWQNNSQSHQMKSSKALSKR